MSGVQYRHREERRSRGMTRRLVCPSIVFLAACAVFAQPPAAPPAFDVASIKPNNTFVREMHLMGDDISIDPKSLTMRGISLQGAIRWAYDVKDYQISGPPWLNSQRFDIAAKCAAPASDAEMRQMMQTLLADRFALKLHPEKKELSVFALLVGKNGPKFHPSEGEGKSTLAGARMIMNAKWTTMAQLADLLYQPLRTPVIDMTGLKGQYDFTVDLAPYAPPSEPGRGPGPIGVAEISGTVLSIVQDQLGLKLESRKSSVDILVIDHAEKTPTDN